MYPRPSWAPIVLICLVLSLAGFAAIFFLGIMLLVMLNGFSERQAEPILLGFGIFILLGHLLVVSGLTLLLGRRWHAGLTFWKVLPITLGFLLIAGLVLAGIGEFNRI